MWFRRRNFLPTCHYDVVHLIKLEVVVRDMINKYYERYD